MGKLSGTVLILAGISLGIHTLSSLDEDAAKVAAARSAGSMEISVETPIPEDLRESSRLRFLAEPAQPAVAAVAPPPQSAEAAAASPTPSTAPAPLDSPPAASRRVRTAGAVLVRIGEAPPRVPVGEPEAVAGPPLDRPALARQIQRQLKRIGCYQGPVTGAWGPSIQQTMKVLMARANASLPIDQPDPVLLAMVESQASGACSRPCPAGEGRAPDGRCLTNALVAAPATPRPSAAPGQGARGKAQAPASERSSVPADTTELLPMKGRMSLAGPAAVRQVPARRGQAATYDPRPASRAATTRSRERYRAAQRPSTGFSGWSWPFFPP